MIAETTGMPARQKGSTSMKPFAAAAFAAFSVLTLSACGRDQPAEDDPAALEAAAGQTPPVANVSENAAAAPGDGNAAAPAADANAADTAGNAQAPAAAEPTANQH